MFVGEGEGVERVDSCRQAVLREGVVEQDFEEDFKREVDEAWHGCGAGWWWMCGGGGEVSGRCGVGIVGKTRRATREVRWTFVFHSM